MTYTPSSPALLLVKLNFSKIGAILRLSTEGAHTFSPLDQEPVLGRASRFKTVQGPVLAEAVATWML